MFQLLQPIWLFFVAATAIPLIIHLWNVREGKTLRIGSIALLQESATQQVRSLRLKDILLLVLRCLLIITLALLLAKPTWEKKFTATNEKGWILIEEQSVNEAYKNYTLIIDSLLRAGYKFHYFKKGFEFKEANDVLKKTAFNKTGNLISYWALLKQLNEEVPSELPVYLFTDNKLKRFAGTRPVVSMNLKWNTYTPADTIITPVVKAYQASTGGIRVIVAHSKPAATFYTFENISNNTSTRYTLINNKGKIFLSPGGTSITNLIEVDTSTLCITIYTDQFSADANYVKAAIDAIQEYTGLKIKVSIANNAGAIKKGGDWLFWLSEKAVPSAIRAPKIFVYETGREQQVNSWIIRRNNFPVSAETIHLSRLININGVSADRAELLWEDGFGHAVLSLEKTSNYTYRFYSRFNPDWNDLPWSAAFAEMIFDLLYKPATGTKNFDNRMISTAQLQPEIAEKSKVISKERFIEKINLDKLFWIIAFIIFCAERYVSLKNDRTESYG